MITRRKGEHTKIKLDFPQLEDPILTSHISRGGIKPTQSRKNYPKLTVNSSMSILPEWCPKE